MLPVQGLPLHAVGRRSWQNFSCFEHSLSCCLKVSRCLKVT